MHQPDRIADPWGPRTPYGPSDEWPVRVDVFLEDGTVEADVELWVPTASVLHSNGDAYDFAVRGGRIVGVRGHAGDRVNHGRLGPKDLFGWQAIGAPDRPRRPRVREAGQLVESDWDTAMGRIVERSRALLDRPGGWGRFGFYTSGQLALEDYYTLAVIGKAGIGTPHMDGNTRLCTATAASSPKASFGTDGQPGSYTDVDHCDAIATWGHNVAETQTMLWARMLDRRRGPRPPRLLAVDPRSTPVTDEADVHLAVRPGTGRPCDYSALTYDLLRQRGGVQWPCTTDHPDGTERLYVDGRFHTDPGDCETFGHDLLTGAAKDETQYRAKEPRGRAFVHGVDFVAPPETPTTTHPFALTTGRTVYKFHTRTKTGRAPQLDAAAPHVWVELCAADADELGVGEGDRVRIRSPRGSIEAPVRIAAIRSGTVFVPFHYGDGHAANELTRTMWDPCDMFAEQASHHAQQLAPLVHGGSTESPSTRFGGPRSGGLGLLRDLHELSLMATDCEISWTAIGQAARGLRDEDLVTVVERADAEIKGQIAWLRTRMKQSAPQALVVAGST